MPTNQSTENHLSKDELFEILNDIDAERQDDNKDSSDPRNEVNPTYQRYPDPSNQFY